MASWKFFFLVFIPTILCLDEVAFKSLSPLDENQVVLLYMGGDEQSEKAIDAVSQAEVALKGMNFLEMAGMKFLKADANKGDNSHEMELKGISNFPMLFVAVQGQGMGNDIVGLNDSFSGLILIR